MSAKAHPHTTSALSNQPFYMTGWFECLILMLCFTLAYILYGLWSDHINVEKLSQSWYDVRTANAMANGKFLDILPQMAQQPLYPMVLAALMKLTHQSTFSDLLNLAKDFNLWLYWVSITLMHAYLQPLIRKPYSLIITLLYTVVPLTVINTLALTPDLLFTVFSLGVLITTERLTLSLKTRTDISKSKLFLVGTLLWAALLTSQWGYCLLVAFLILGLKQFKTKATLVTIGLVLLGVLPWYLIKNAYQHLDFNGAIHLPATWQAGVYPMAVQLTQSTLGKIDLQFLHLNFNALHAYEFSQYSPALWLVGGFTGLGMVMGFFRSSGLGSLYLLGYALTMVFTQPPAYQGYGCDTVILPLVFFYLYYGLMEFGTWMKRLYLPVSRILSPLVTVLILISALCFHLNAQAASYY